MYVERPRERTEMRPFLKPLLILLFLLVCAEFGYRFYDSNTSLEVAASGIRFKGEPVHGEVFESSVKLRDAGHQLVLTSDCENGTEEDVQDALVGISAMLTVTDSAARKTWTIPVTFSALEDEIRQYSSVDLKKADGFHPDIPGIGKRYKIVYEILPASGGEADFEGLKKATFERGTTLSVRVEFQTRPGTGTRMYLAYSRFPRLLHQRLMAF